MNKVINKEIVELRQQAEQGDMEDVAFEELDIVKITTNAYRDDGLNYGERGTVVLVHNNSDEAAYEVEFNNWTKKFPIKVKTLAGNEIEMVEK